MVKTVWLVHGIREAPWNQPSMSLMRDLLHVYPGWKVNLVRYGYRLIPVTNRRAINALKEVVEPGDIVVGYSNGAWAALQAAEIGVPIEALFLVNPALHPIHEVPKHVREVHVFYCEKDFATVMGQVWRNVTRIFPWRWKNPHGWGAMGRVGYQGDDPRITNYELVGDPGHGGIREADSIIQVSDVVYEYTRRNPI